MFRLKGSRTCLLLLFSMFLLGGCASNVDKEKAESSASREDQIVIYTTLYPLLDFAQKIAGDHAAVENIVPPGVESHDFEPTAKDMMKLNEADLLLYNGAGFEGWVEKSVKALNNEDLIVVETSKNIELLSPVEEQEGDHGHDEDHHGEFDPHIWLDPNRAKLQAAMIKDALVELDPEHKSDYENNFNSLSQKFDELNTLLKDLAAHAMKKELVVSHAAFGYLTGTYGLQQLSISGLTPSDEPTQQELQHIIEEAKAHQVKYILFETMVSGKIAETVKNEIGAQALTLSTLENLTKEQIDQGKDYFSVMKENIDTLKIALEYKS